MSRVCSWILTVLLAGCLSLPGWAQETPDRVRIAPVVVDGQVLLRVRGVSAVPAEVRAEKIRRRLLEVARNTDIDLQSAELAKGPQGFDLLFGGEQVLHLYQVDADLEEVPLDILAEATLQRLQLMLTQYRAERSPEKLLRSTGYFLGATLLAALAIWASVALVGWINKLVERGVARHIERLEQASHRIIHGGQVWNLIGMAARGVRLLAIVAIVLVWINTALGLYPWTRQLAVGMFSLVLNPLRQLGVGLVSSVPNLVFLLVLAMLVRFILRGIQTFFNRVERGWIRLESFERDWAMPTYRIVRTLIIVFALVVAYPYIPGSDSDAFKGIGIFMGVVLSIGSTSFISNMLAGYSLTFRAAYREGDRVRIGEHLGEVVEIRSLYTRLRSLKNEQINIPNSAVLNSAVVNYSAYQRSDGLILHTEVGIGYDTPWRQVEAMLLQAAARTEGLLTQPAPYVLQRGLGDFTVVYELNAFTRDAGRINALYSLLHANIQDVFNEYGVQIMSPHYERDPEQPKLVRPEDFYRAPARPPAAAAEGDTA